VISSATDNKTNSCLLRNARRKTMSKLSALILIATLTTAASALPAFAQSFDPEVGTGNIVSFNAAPAPHVLHMAAAGKTGRAAVATREAGLHAFAMILGAPGGRVGTTYDLALTGGGSLGYN
jgi:hypothetical protein